MGRTKKTRKPVKKTTRKPVKKELIIRASDEITAPVPASVSESMIREYITTFGLAAQLNENEQLQFIRVAQLFNLNPFKREIYCIPYMCSVQDTDGNWTKERRLSLITGYEVYLKRAETLGVLNGWNVIIEGTGEAMKAIITIHRRDRNVPLIHEVLFKEYNTGKKMWKEKPTTMLKKVAIAQGFRMCFPSDFAGMPYTSDELPENMVISQKEQENGVIDGPKIPQILPPDNENDKKIKDMKENMKEKLDKLPDNIKDGFKNIGYEGKGKAVYLFCEKFGWNENKIMAEINRIADIPGQIENINNAGKK